jgi:hypothetical protein
MRWLLIAIAVVGTAFFGASLVELFVIREWVRPAIWLTVWTGGAWLYFIHFLAKRTNLPYTEVLDHSLVAMAIGECVLMAAALINFAGFGSLASNIAMVALSNIVMFAVLQSRLKRVGAAWMMLNCAGLLLAIATFPILTL